MTNQSEIRIYAACLAAYNNSILHGCWIDADQDAEDIQAEITAMLKTSPEPDAEEWAIHDYEGFGGVSISEYEVIERVAELAVFISEHNALGAAVLERYGNDLDEAKEALEERYCGEYVCLADYAKELTEQSTEIPEQLAFYIDYDRMGRDMTLSGDIEAIETGFGEVHIFWSA